MISVTWILFSSLHHIMTAESEAGDYHNEFAVHVPGGREVAETVAEEHGLVVLREIGALEDHYLLESKLLQKRSTEPCSDTHTKLEADTRQRWKKDFRNWKKIGKGRVTNYLGQTRMGDQYQLSTKLGMRMGSFWFLWLHQDQSIGQQWFPQN